jgi:GNAT superfamily N-acetyltransferase
MTEGPRPPESFEFGKVVEFLDKSLRPSGTWTIQQEYPTALSLSNLGNMRIMFDESAIVSHAVLKPVLMRSPHLNLKVGAIGSVVTDSNHRNKGFSRQIILDCIKAAEDQNCDFAILWTNLFDFYQKLGFTLAGTEVSLVIEKEFTAPSSDGSLRFVSSNKISAEAIHKLYCQHTVYSIRTPEEIRKFLNIPNSKVFTAWDQSNNLVAYAVEGKGADLGGYIHEWGGSVTKLISLLSYVRKELGKPLTILCPEHSQNLIGRLLPYTSVRNDGYLGMIKITNPESFCKKIQRAFASSSFFKGEFIFEFREGAFYFGTGSKVFRTDNASEIVKLVFGPSSYSSTPAHQLNQFDPIFPIQMWMWGWDSI